MIHEIWTIIRLDADDNEMAGKPIEVRFKSASIADAASASMLREDETIYTIKREPV